ncbi:hypothetical protein [Gramella sp. MAR_2010_147]|uniref:hypothetical protein n=1 Tax=Gramella sp. MAR_2010_147 TaxID=1250205 RepID=UPI000B7DDB54|nr:hypothetical protein [Gramella sp. MAR_2010_147]
MRTYSIIVSIITLIFGFTFYGENLTINIHDTYYIIAAEVVCFSIWLLCTIIFQLINLKNYLSKNAA